MPLLCFDLIQGRSEKQIDMILDVTHEVLVKSFDVPDRDRYQIVREHAPSRMIVQDSGLGIVNFVHVGPSSYDPPSQSGYEASVLTFAGGETGRCLRYCTKRRSRHFRDEYRRRLVVWARAPSIPHR